MACLTRSSRHPQDTPSSQSKLKQKSQKSITQMARFRAPSVCSSDDSFDGNDAKAATSTPVNVERTPKRNGLHPTPFPMTPSRPTKANRRAKGKKPRHEIDPIKLREKFKAAAKKSKVQAQVGDREWSYVFVGNLDPRVTDNDLTELFQRCGIIHHIAIRASHGAGVSSVTAPTGIRDRCYATVEFKRNGAARAALALNGTKVSGIPIQVCLSPADLPEVRQIMASQNWIQKLANVRRRIRPLVYERTELIPIEVPTPQSQEQPTTGHQVPLEVRFTFPKTLV